MTTLQKNADIQIHEKEEVKVPVIIQENIQMIIEESESESEESSSRIPDNENDPNFNENDELPASEMNAPHVKPKYN